MKKLYFLMLFFGLLAFTTKAQVFFEEGFSSMPPAGWAIDAHANNWSSEGSSNAGGSSPEGMFSWSPQFNGESHLIAPSTDLSGYTTVAFSFMHMIDHYGGPYTVGVATRSGGGTWTTVWEVVSPSGSVPGEEVNLTISNSDVGQPDFEVCFFFSGDSYNINYWYIDDAKLFIPQEHDVATKVILGDTYFAQGDVYGAEAIVRNAGLNAETFDVVLEIYDEATDELLFTDTQNASSLDPGMESTIVFANYTLPYENALYQIDVYTDLPGDMDPSNDMQTSFIYTYTSEREMVLVEIGTGTWCGYCPGAAMGADDLIANGHNVAVIENHNGDDYANQYSNARNSYYGITGYPTAVFDGVEFLVGGSATQSMYPNYLPIFEGRTEIMSAFSCELYGNNTSGNDYEVTGMIHKLGPAMNANVVFHIVLTESHIPEIWGNQDHLNFVTRLMMPDENGTVVDVINNDYIEVDESFTIDPTWDVNECELVYFLQDLDTKEILQGGKVMVNDLLGVGISDMEESAVAIHNIYPNPFSHETNINFSLASNSNVIVSISDMTGREVAMLANQEMAAGDHQITWEAGKDMPNGIYFCTISTADHKLTQKVMLAK
ncbi:MAG: T9SS type A sorting domain-containing protein [Bacteroidota bacterium]